MTRTERLFLEAVFIGILLIFSMAFLRLMEPFLLDVFLALVLANIFRKPYLHLTHATGRPRLASSLMIIVVFLVVALPVAMVATLVSAELAGAVANVRQNWSSLQSSIGIPNLLAAAEDLPVIGQLLSQFSTQEITNTIREILSTSGDYLLRLSQRSIGNITAAVFNFAIILLLLYFFFVDGHRLVDRVYETIPVSNRDMDQIVSETFNTTSATLISTIIIGLMEGGLATVLFLVFRLPSPFLWGVITMVLSMIPLIGTNLVLVPAGLITLAAGRPGAGIMIIITGAVGVAITQNVVKPKLLGDRSGLHPALALLSTIGGIAWLGLIGFLVGPVLAALFVVVWRQFTRRYRSLLEGKNLDLADESTR
ncbi:MAG: AI-2E family transporter [Alkalispirochaeta sp.]